MLRERLKTTTTMPTATPPAAETVQPKYCSITRWCDMTGMGRRTVYEKLGTGELRAVKLGAKTMIDVEPGLSWLRSLPPAVIRAPRVNAPPASPPEERQADFGFARQTARGG